ncbi:hypothetical protein BDV23DRAFT_168708 [Aspergillus alliaceus]|uniref:Zn(2)-C6 fungal-type domain-containing protein n=1 Tax=Petromyces alliaceus TaxID=209559 RepID=A0A5N7CMW4_PETAA|nr:hypothetical protein BDV23DRAFT_168708 [Aspergillus alliaceus]
MPPRRSHTKSRTGCLQCKRRRVKCDERGPPCGNCITRELQCAYSSAPAIRRVSDSLSRSPSSPQFSITTNGIPTPPSTVPTHHDLRSLELMHKFSTETYHSLSSRPSYDHAWQIIMPRKALDHDFLLDGILSIASLHTAATKGPTQARPYIDTALEYQNRALTPFRHALNNITPANCDVIYAYSVITIASGIVLPQLSAENDGNPNTIENILHVFVLLQGTTEILKTNRAWLAQSSFPPVGDYWEGAARSLDRETEEAFERLTAMNRQKNSTFPEAYCITEEAVALLRRCFCRYSTMKDPGSVITWLAVVNRRFVDTLRGLEPLSLLILGHWGVLLAKLDGKVWWAFKSGRALVVDTLQVCGTDDVEFRDAWAWPKQQLGL